MNPPLIALIHNFSLLVALAVIYDVMLIKPVDAPAWATKILSGLILGAVGISVMLTPWVLVPGVVFDTRSIVLALAGLFFGAIPTTIAVIVTATLRFVQGGVAAWAGVLVICASGALGVYWGLRWRDKLADISPLQLYLFGLAVHIVMLLMMLTLPWPLASSVLSQITVPVLTVYPVGMLMLGLLLRNRLRRERADERLRESEERYRLLADNVSDVLWILNVDNWCWEYVSPSVERLCGFTAEEVMTRSLEQMVVPSSYAPLRIRMEDAIAEVRTTNGHRHSSVIEVEQLCKDGSTVWTEVVTRYTHNKQGALLVLGISRNIADRKKAEDELRLSEENFQRLVTDAPMAIFVQTDGRFAYVNKAAIQLFGAEDAAQLIGQPIIERFHPDVREQVRNRIKVLNQDRQQVDLVEETILRLDDTPTDAEVAAVPFVFHAKSGALVFLLDVSAKKRATESAFALALERKRVEMLSLFVRDISHEFRTPLSIIQAKLYLLEQSPNIEHRKRQAVEIKQQIVGITRLLEMLTESTRLENDAPIDKQPIDLNYLLTEVVDAIGDQTPLGGAPLKLTLSPNLPPIAGDPARLSMALREIVGNAVRYTPANGTISIASRRCAQGGVVVEIRDSGPGIPVQALPHIFEHFYRQDTAHTTPGLGLGLPIAQAIVHSHGGRIEVESQPGVGTLFRVLLPAATDG